MQNVQDLINKIKTEGVLEADQKAAEIEAEARKKAAAIIAQAQQEAALIKAAGEEAAEKFAQSARASIGQGARDVLLALRQDVQDLLRRIIDKEVGTVLSVDRLSAIIEVVARTAAAGAVITLNADDLAILKSGFLARLQQDLQKGISFAPRNDRAKGLTVSFDKGKSCFDLTEAALASYFAGFVSEDLAAIIRK